MSSAGVGFFFVFLHLSPAEWKTLPLYHSITLSHHHQQQRGRKRKKTASSSRRPWKCFSWDGRQWTSAAAETPPTSQSQLERKKNTCDSQRIGAADWRSAPALIPALNQQLLSQIRHFRLLQEQTHRYLVFIIKIEKFRVILLLFFSLRSFQLYSWTNQVPARRFAYFLFNKKETLSSPWNYYVL